MKRFAMLLLCIALSLACAACSSQREVVELPPMTVEPFTGVEEASKLYSQVELGETRAALEERFGGPGEKMEIEEGVYYEWHDGASGVLVVFWADGTVRSKTLHFEDRRQICALTGPFDLSVSNIISKNSNFTDAKLVIGQSSPGLEIARAHFEEENGSLTASTLYAWANEDGSMLHLDVLDNEKIYDVRVYVYAPEASE